MSNMWTCVSLFELVNCKSEANIEIWASKKLKYPFQGMMPLLTLLLPESNIDTNFLFRCAKHNSSDGRLLLNRHPVDKPEDGITLKGYYAHLGLTQ